MKNYNKRSLSRIVPWLEFRSLQERCMSVIVSALVEQRSRDPDELCSRLPDYVPTVTRSDITDSLWTKWIPPSSCSSSHSGSPLPTKESPSPPLRESSPIPSGSPSQPSGSPTESSSLPRKSPPSGSPSPGGSMSDNQSSSPSEQPPPSKRNNVL